MESNKLKNGYLTEEKFILECLNRNIHISRPIFNIEPYDFIVELDNKLYKVQVKKSWVDSKNRNITCLKSSYPRSNIKRVASQNVRIDFLAILTENDEWYIIPRKIISHIKSSISVSKFGNYAKYINNFDFKE